jgi:hypothetical protein
MTMQSKYLVIPAALAFGAVYGLSTLLADSVAEAPATRVAAYVPAAQSAPANSPDGAFEIRKMMLADMETGEINAAGLRQLEEAVIERAAKDAAAGAKATEHFWNEMGPDNIGGRARAICAVTEQVLFSGGVSGGLWKSTDAANHWVQVKAFPVPMVASIAYAGNGDLYVGTGSQFDNGGGEGGSGFRGRGIWRSTDLGETWEVVEGTDPGALGSGDFTATDALVADPNNPDRVYFGGDAGFGYIENGELMENAGDGLPSNPVGDIAVAADGSYMLVAMGNGRVYRSNGSDFGTFSAVSGSGDNLLPQSGLSRARVDISPDDANHAYALYANSQRLFGGLYHSADGGFTWEEIWPDGLDELTPLPRAQGVYDLALGVVKGNPELAYVGGIEIWRSGPTQQAEQAAFAFDFPGTNFDVHADIHEIIFTPGGVMYVATDGGLYKSLDAGETYIECNRDFSVTQFYGIDHSAGSAVLGGTQDNGSLFIPANGTFLSDQEAIEVNGGDGFDCAISQITDTPDGTIAWMASSQNGGLVRGNIAPGNFNNYGNFWDEDILELVNESGEVGQFYSVVRLYENTDDPDTQREVILVNPYGVTVTDSTFTLNTSNLNLPFDYTLPEGAELPHYDEIVRPERVLDAPLTEDPDYFWLEPQSAEEVIECTTDSVMVGTEEVIESITIVYDSIFVEQLNEYYVFELTIDTTFTTVDVYEFTESCDTMYFHASDVITDEPGRLKVRDPYTTITATGFVGSQGIWITRDGLNFNTTPDWIRLDNAPAGGGTKAIEFTVNVEPEAGNYMFVSGWDGKLYRFDDLETIWSQEDVPSNMRKEIESAGAAITGIAVDPNNPNHVVITVGGYGTSAQGKVRETFNALADAPTWSNIWYAAGELSRMPCYDVVIDAMDATGQTILVGTEFGTYATDNGGDDWTYTTENTGAPNGVGAPVFDLKQQWRGPSPWITPSNQGAIYAGTHGRGIFRSDLFLGVEEEEQVQPQAVSSLLVFPNPSSQGQLNVRTQRVQGQVQVELFDLMGRVVFQEQVNGYAGTTLTLNVAHLPSGTYILRMANGNLHEVAQVQLRN